MGKIDLTINKTGLQHNIEKAKENNVIIPTIAQMQHPETIPEKIQEKLKTVGLWDVNPLNLFRITWKNEAKETGGLYQAVPNYVEIPSELSGVPCRILAMAGKWFPTAATRSALRSAASPRASSPASSTRRIITPCGPPPVTTAAAARSTRSSSPSTPSPFSPRR